MSAGKRNYKQERDQAVKEVALFFLKCIGLGLVASIALILALELFAS